MIAKKGYLLALIILMQGANVLSVQTKGQRPVEKASERAVLSQEELFEILRVLEELLAKVRYYDGKNQNRAPRPNAAQPCDGVYPACNVLDLTELTNCCCAIRNLLDCVETQQCSFLDILGNCTDQSILLPSTVAKSDIDAICASTVTLLKTILLELRGAFVTV